MLRDLAHAINQLFEPGMRRWVVAGVLLASAVLAALIAAIETVLGLFGRTGHAWLDWTIWALGGVGSLVGAWFLFPAAVSVAFGLLFERIVDAVERRHYPDLPAPRPSGLLESITAATRLGLLALVLNLLAMPFYLVPGANVVLALLLNGYLIGREYFEGAAIRRMSVAEARALRRDHGGAVMVAGMVVAGILLIPLVNLFAPAAGIAFLTHRFHSLSPRSVGHRAARNVRGLRSMV